MANLSNINNKFIVTDGNNGRVLIGATNDIGATLFANHPSTTAPSLTFNAPAGQVFENEDLQIAFGLNNAVPYNGYMQTRFVSAPYHRNLAINPLGGDVGIGTNSPAKKLDVEGNIRTINTGGTVAAEIDVTSGSTWRLRSNPTSGTNNYGLDIIKGGAGTDVKMSIDSSGNVGIGTPSPSGKLNVEAPGNHLHLRAGTAAAGKYWNFDVTANNQLYIITDSNNGINITNTGYVGIGTNIPNAKLSIGSGVAKTSTSTSEVLYLGQSNEASNYSTLQVYTKGGASQADRSVVFQTIEAGVANAGNIVLQPSGGNVGIGVTSPSTKLDVAGEISSSDDINVNNGKLVVNHTSAEVRIKSSSNTGESYVSFSDPSDINPGQIYYGHSDNAMRFRTNDAERMRITSSGNVNVGVFETGSGAITGPLVVTHGSSRFMTASYEQSIVSLNAKNNNNNLESLRLAGDNIIFYSGSGTTGSERIRITSDGEFRIGTGTGANGKLHIVNTDKNRKTYIEGNGNNQGFARKSILVNQYPVVSSGSQLIIPFTSQGNLNSTTIIKIWGHSARFNSSDALGFEATIQVGHLQQLYSVSALNTYGNISGISTSGMNLIISFTTAYSNAVSDGIFATIEYMTNNLSYSLQPTNIVMN